MSETSELITIALPRYALIYLVRMLREERDRLATDAVSAAAFDSLTELEDSIPHEIWIQVQRERQRP